MNRANFGKPYSGNVNSRDKRKRFNQSGGNVMTAGKLPKPKSLHEILQTANREATSITKLDWPTQINFWTYVDKAWRYKLASNRTSRVEILNEEAVSEIELSDSDDDLSAYKLDLTKAYPLGTSLEARTDGYKGKFVNINNAAKILLAGNGQRHNRIRSKLCRVSNGESQN